MAGDWIKVEKATARKPEVLRVADTLSIHPDHAFGLCFRFWCWCDDQLENGNAAGVTETLVDALVERSGFASALVDVGWLQVRNGSLVIPNFDRHLSQSAKSRALTATRVKKHKSKNGNALSVTSALPREEKRREEKSNKETPLPPCLQTEAFQSAWRAWQAHRTELKKPLRPTMAEEQLAMLSKLGEQRAVGMIRHTIAMGWQGLREPDNAPAAKVTLKGLADDL